MSDYRAHSPLPARRGSGHSIGGGTMEDEPSTPPLTACLRCRKQKLRCSRDLPVCKRCKDISAVCDYPPPPDRKLLAAQRLQNAKTRVRRESKGSGSHQTMQSPRSKETGASSHSGSANIPLSRSEQGDDTAIPNRRISTGISHEDLRKEEPPLQASLRRTTLPSPEVAIFLIEIYFVRLYNANLLFHKRTFLNEYALNRVPDFLALSIFALASIFLRQNISGPSSKDEDQDGVDLGISMLSAADSAKQGLEWATAASQRALMQSDVPRMETVQACQNLGLYWFAQGEFNRAHIHTAIAYKTAKLLNLHIQQETNNKLADEAARRVFWACWITSCISQDNANFKAEPWQETIGLHFPSDEDSYTAENPKTLEFFDEDGNIAVEESLKDQQPSIMAEHVKLFNLWWEIQHFIKRHNSTPVDDINNNTVSLNFVTLLELDRRLNLIFENLHPDLRHETASPFTGTKLDPYKLFQLHCLHRLCACSLHSSIVPLFSPTPSSNSAASRKLVRLSAEEAVKHAAITLDLATAFLSTNRPDMSRLSSITGFAIYVALIVHVKSLVAQRKLYPPFNATNSSHTGRLKAAVCILAYLKDYWVTLKGLWRQLQTIFLAAVGLPLEGVCNASTHVPSSSNENDLPTDYEKIAAAKNTPDDGTGDLYTYVADQEAKPRRASGGGGSAGSGDRSKSAQNTPSPKAMLQTSQAQRSLPVIRGRGVMEDSGGVSEQQQQQPFPPNSQVQTEILTPLLDAPTHILQQNQQATNIRNCSPLQQHPHAPDIPPHSRLHPHSTSQPQQYTIMPPPPFLPTVTEEPSPYVLTQGFGPVADYGDPGVMAMEMDINMHGGFSGDMGTGGELWWNQSFVPGSSAGDLDSGVGREVEWNVQGRDGSGGHRNRNMNEWRMEGLNFG